MKVPTGNAWPTRLHRVAIATVASATVAIPAVHAQPADSRVVVPPADLPEVARHAGEAMLLRQTLDGRALLYIEQNQGARLAILDVTDPAFVRAERSVRLAASGSFDFISTLGSGGELVRFRQSQLDAVLDMHNVDAPILSFTLPHDEKMSIARGPAVERANSQQPDGVADVRPVPVKVANSLTGTTFLLTQDGLYLIRQREAEMLEKWREQAYSN